MNPGSDIEFNFVLHDEWQIIHSIAHATWPATYGEMISSEQLKYMLELNYSERSLKKQMDRMHQFVVGYQSEKPVGFASLEQGYHKDQLMIHKLYILPENQGRGIGKAFLNFITSFALQTGHTALSLKVFLKNQKAIQFYKNIGFSIEGELETDLGNDYLIIDYIMVKRLNV